MGFDKGLATVPLKVAYCLNYASASFMPPQSRSHLLISIEKSDKREEEDSFLHMVSAGFETGSRDKHSGASEPKKAYYQFDDSATS